MSEQKHYWVWAYEFLWITKWHRFKTQFWDPEKVGCQGFAGDQTNANRFINKKYDWYLELNWRFNVNSRKSRK